jgi:hypothetical protein
MVRKNILVVVAPLKKCTGHDSNYENGDRTTKRSYQDYFPSNYVPDTAV